MKYQPIEEALSWDKTEVGAGVVANSGAVVAAEAGGGDMVIPGRCEDDRMGLCMLC